MRSIIFILIMFGGIFLGIACRKDLDAFCFSLIGVGFIFVTGLYHGCYLDKDGDV